MSNNDTFSGNKSNFPALIVGRFYSLDNLDSQTKLFFLFFLYPPKNVFLNTDHFRDSMVKTILHIDKIFSLLKRTDYMHINNLLFHERKKKSPIPHLLL